MAAIAICPTDTYLRFITGQGLLSRASVAESSVVLPPVVERGVMSMPQYRIYYVGLEGRFSHAEEIECDGDQAAIEKTH